MEDKIEIGDSVKIKIIGRTEEGEPVHETPWATVKGRNKENGYLQVVLDNHPVSAEWELGDEIEIPPHFVLRKWIEPDTNQQEESDENS